MQNRIVFKWVIPGLFSFIIGHLKNKQQFKYEKHIIVKSLVLVFMKQYKHMMELYIIYLYIVEWI